MDRISPFWIMRAKQYRRRNLLLGRDLSENKAGGAEIEELIVVKSALFIAIVALLAFDARALARDDLAASIEWWTNISDTVLVAKVSDLQELKIPNLDWKAQQVSLKTTSVLKGKRLDKLTLRQDYLDLERFYGGESFCIDHALRKGNEVLVFCARRDPKS